jgi:hypothetical protein
MKTKSIVLVFMSVWSHVLVAGAPQNLLTLVQEGRVFETHQGVLNQVAILDGVIFGVDEGLGLFAYHIAEGRMETLMPMKEAHMANTELYAQNGRLYCTYKFPDEIKQIMINGCVLWENNLLKDLFWPHPFDWVYFFGNQNKIIHGDGVLLEGLDEAERADNRALEEEILSLARHPAFFLDQKAEQKELWRAVRPVDFLALRDIVDLDDPRYRKERILSRVVPDRAGKMMAYFHVRFDDPTIQDDRTIQFVDDQGSVGSAFTVPPLEEDGIDAEDLLIRSGLISPIQGLSDVALDLDHDLISVLEVGVGDGLGRVVRFFRFSDRKELAWLPLPSDLKGLASGVDYDGEFLVISTIKYIIFFHLPYEKMMSVVNPD